MTSQTPNWVDEFLSSSGLSELGHEAPLTEVEVVLRKLAELAAGFDGLKREIAKQVTMERLRALRPAPAAAEWRDRWEGR